MPAFSRLKKAMRKESPQAFQVSSVTLRMEHRGYAFFIGAKPPLCTFNYSVKMSIMDENILRLYKSSIALMQLKGGAGKTLLLTNLAAVAAEVYDWNVLLVDLDANAPLTGAIFGGYETDRTVIEALERVARQEQVDDLLTYASNLGVYLLKGDIRGISTGHIRWIPHLIQELKRVSINTKDGPRPVDCVFIDVPGENRDINVATLAGIDYVAMPAMISSPDIAAMSITLQLITRAQSQRGGKPAFLGIIPNRISRRGVIERAFLDVLIKSGKILPFIPSSDIVRSTLFRQSRQGKEGVISFAPNSLLSKRMIHLWEALNSCSNNGPECTKEFSEFIGGQGLLEYEKDSAYAKE